MKAVNNSSGIQSEKRLGIVILPPWWATWWAYGLYAFLLAIGMWFVHRFQKARVVRSEREKAQKMELAQAKEIEKAYKQLKTTQQQLIQSEKMASLGELTAGIAHEIQNPLNFVNNFSEVNRELIEELKEEKTKNGKNRNDDMELELLSDIDQNLEKISHHGKRADSIVKGMLQHSRSGDGKKEPTDLNALADEYLRLAYHGLRAKDKSFNACMETDLDPGLPEVNVVPQDIGRVLLNLITNAFHAVSDRKRKVPEGFEPTVWVSTRKTDKGVEISVRDNGGGIPEEIRDKIFQPFFTTKPTGEGTGLGLSMSYDIVTKGHGGGLTFAGAKPEGTEFHIFIPVNGA
jgi:signal transduction histidine kinase